MTPLVLVVGFLGAGKTTLLRRALPELIAAGVRPALVLNDYQNARVDAEYFRSLEDLVRPISGSCVCCGSREELVEALLALPRDATSLVFVETNGTTDAEELVGFLASEPRLRQFSLPWQVSVVDAKRWQKRFWHNALEAGQLRTAQAIVLTHTAGLASERLEAVRQSLQRLGLGERVRAEKDMLTEWIALATHLGPACVRRELPPCTAPAPNIHAAQDHDASHFHFAACELALPAMVEEKRLRQALLHLPPEVLRAKGVVRLREYGPDTWFIFQKIGHFEEVQIASLELTPTVATPLAIFVGAPASDGWREEFVRTLSR